MNKLIIITFLILTSFGCQIKNRGVYFLDNYNQNDSLFIHKFILFSTYERKKLDYGIVHSDSDSLFNVFKSSLNDLNLPIIFHSTPSNKVNNRIIDTHHSKYNIINRIDYDSIMSYVGDIDTNKNILIPFIKFNFSKSHNINVAGADTYYVVQLTVVVFIVKNKKIIYANEAFILEYLDDDKIPDYYNYYNIPIPHEKWDNIVGKVMREYIERLN